MVLDAELRMCQAAASSADRIQSGAPKSPKRSPQLALHEAGFVVWHRVDTEEALRAMCAAAEVRAGR